ncbi:MAG: cell surface receptor IPT/TIG domain-containing protein, partial [Epulopiscium sp.]|nr:cell surface receptor IPT/TIG domain-containing protein [Candidatus Epulonipiscium sp.]
MHKKISRYIAFIMIFIMGITMLPQMPIYAADGPVEVKQVIIGRNYDKNRIFQDMYITIKGSNLQGASVAVGNLGKYTFLKNGQSSSDGTLLQFELTENISITDLAIGGIDVDVNFGDEIPRYTGVNKNKVKLGEDLVITGTNLHKVDGSQFKVKYGQNEYQTIGKGSDANKIIVEKPTGKGLQNIVFTGTRNDGSVNIEMNYIYQDQFRLTEDLTIGSDLEMFPNRGAQGDTVYFTADQLKEYDVFFLKALDGTDPYTNSNKGLNPTYQAKMSADGKDTITVQVPKLPVGEYFVVITNKISEGKDPMKEVSGEFIVPEKFTIIDASNKMTIDIVDPSKGPDTGQEVTITGKLIGSLNLNIDGYTLTSSEPKKISQSSSEPDAIELGSWTFGPDDNKLEIESVIRTIRVIIGNKATFVEKDGKYAVSFSKGLDRVTVRTPRVTDADTNPVKDVVIETETVVKKKNGSTLVFTERAVKSKGYTYIPSTVAPEITEVVPNLIQVQQNGSVYQIPSDRYIAVYGKNFMIHKYTDENGNQIVRYPIVQLGEITIDKNTDPDVFLKVFDAYGKELDGSSNNEIGTKILILLKEGTPEEGVTLGKAAVTVVNPMRNSDEGGLSTTVPDIIDFVLPDSLKHPTIENVIPNVVPVEGGDEVTVTGSNFTDGVRVFIDGAEVRSIKREGDGRTITFKAPPGREGQTQLQVMNPEGAMATFPFTYVKTFTDPKITSIQPRQGNTGTLVVIKGNNFLKPDPTGGKDAVYRLIGTRVLIEGQDVNSYNINPSTKEIRLEEFKDPGEPLFSIEDKSLKTARYYHSIVLVDNNEKCYTVDLNSSGVPIISDGIGNEYKIQLGEGGTKLQASKVGGTTFELKMSGGEITIGETLTLTMFTPFLIKPNKEGKNEIVGDNVKVIDKNTIYFTVPVLDFPDGWYDVTVQNPDTKKDTKKDQEGFYYYAHPQSEPEIYEIIPSEGSVYGNNIITIYGKEFIETGDKKAKVFVNGVEVDPSKVQISTSGNSITLVVPPYAGDLFADKGVGRWAVPVVVINPDGGSCSLENGYTYIVPKSHPEITRIIPNAGSAAGGTIVEIFGNDFRFSEPYEDLNKNQKWDEGEPFIDFNGNGKQDKFFDLTEEEIEEAKKPLNPPLYPYEYYYDSPFLPNVYFGMEKAKIVEFNSTYIKVITPKGPKGTVGVYVENNDGGRSNTVNYTYQGSNPKITKVSPNAGDRSGGVNIGIYGSDFRQSPIKVYKNTSEKENLNMTLVQFGDNTNKNIPRDRPNSGLINQGHAQVSLEKDFIAIYKAENTPDGFKSQIQVTLKYKDVTYFNTFTEFNDEESFINTNMLVDGEDNAYPFSELIRFSIVDRRFIVERGFAPAVNYIDSTELSVTIPPYHTVGIVPLRVINPDGGVAQSTFEYRNPDSNPSIIDITNQNVSPVTERITIDGREIDARVIRVNYKGGNTIKVIGDDFRDNARIFIGEILDIGPNNINYDGLPRLLTFEMPAVSESSIGKFYRLVVLNEDGGSAASDELSPPIYITFVKGESNPGVTNMTPDKGPAAGGTKVTIEGKDFRSHMEGFTDTIHVYFGEIPARDITVSRDGKFIYVTTPAHEPGAVTVKIQNPDGIIVTVPKPFTFISNPKITKVTDLNELTEIKTISVEGGEEIKLKGFGFKEGAKVYFNPVIKKADTTTRGNVFYIEGEAYTLESGIEAKAVEFIDSETVKVTTPEGNKDSFGVILINQDGGATNIYGLSYSLPEVDAPQGVRADLIYDRYIKITWSEVPGARE